MNDKLLKVKALLTELEQALADVSLDAELSEEQSVQDIHRDAVINSDGVCALDHNNNVINNVYPGEWELEHNRLGCPQYYLDTHFALLALDMKHFNDLLLMFKFHKDRDYKPDWSDGSKAKFYIVKAMGSADNKYISKSTTYMRQHTVYFSSAEIANECANWLNQIFTP